MNWYQDFEDDLAWVFHEAETVINEFPAPLNMTGLVYLNGFNVLKEGSSNNYICYLLPFWLMDYVPVDRNTCRRLSLANVFGMLYYFVQDDLMDSPSSQKRLLIPLANLLHLQYLERYAQLLAPASSFFWKQYTTYTTEWADAVANEMDAPHFADNPLHIARKSSPLKLCSTSACLLMDRESLIPSISTAIDLVLTTIQMADDWVDWREDLQEGNYNSLIDFIHPHSAPKDDVEWRISSVKRALYVKGILQNYAQIAVDQHNQLLKLNISIPQLISFHHSIVQYLLDEAGRIDANRDNLIQGGFHNWMTKMRE